MIAHKFVKTQERVALMKAEKVSKTSTDVLHEYNREILDPSRRLIRHLSVPFDSLLRDKQNWVH